MYLSSPIICSTLLQIQSSPGLRLWMIHSQIDCAMVEVDFPQMDEGWSLSEDPLPRLTSDQIQEAENVLSDVNVPEPTGYCKPSKNFLRWIT